MYYDSRYMNVYISYSYSIFICLYLYQLHMHMPSFCLDHPHMDACLVSKDAVPGWCQACGTSSTCSASDCEGLSKNWSQNERQRRSSFVPRLLFCRWRSPFLYMFVFCLCLDVETKIFDRSSKSCNAPRQWHQVCYTSWMNRPVAAGQMAPWKLWATIATPRSCRRSCAAGQARKVGRAGSSSKWRRTGRTGGRRGPQEVN